MLVAGGLRTIERVLDHRAPEQGRGQRVLALDQPRRRIEQVIQVPVDLGGPREHELGGPGLVRPSREEVERGGEAPEAEGVLHGPLLGLDVVEVRQPLQVGAQPVGREPLLERRPAQPLGLILPARRLERLDVGRFPRVIRGKSDEMEVVVTRGFGGAPLRPCPFQRGNRVGRPAGSEKPAASASSSWRWASCRPCSGRWWRRSSSAPG